MIGLLCTSEGIPVAHHVFRRQRQRRLCAARRSGRSSRAVRGGPDLRGRRPRPHLSRQRRRPSPRPGSTHLLATRLRRDRAGREALEAIDGDTAWVDIARHRCRAADIALSDGTRAVVVESAARARRDNARRAELVAAAEGRAAGPGAPRPRRPAQRPREDRASRPARPRRLRRRAALRRRDRSGPLHLPLQRRRPRP